MMKRSLAIFLIYGFLSLPANAEVTMDECREMARKNHPAIRTYGLIEATRECSLSNASRLWLPSIQIGGLAGGYNNPISIDDLFASIQGTPTGKLFLNTVIHGMLNVVNPSPHTYKASAALNQHILDGGAATSAKKIAEAEAQVHRAETDVTLQQVCNRVDEIYFSILLLEKRIMQLESKQEVLYTAKDRVASLLESGSARSDELDEMDAACIETEQKKVDMESSLKYFRLALSLLTGKDLMTDELIIPPALPQPQATPQILLLDNRMNLLALERDKLNVAVRPHLDLVADAYYGYPNRNIFADLVSYSPGANFFVGLRLSWNLSAFYTRKNNLTIISNSMKRIDVQKDILKLDIRLRNNAVDTEMERLQKCLERDDELISIRKRLRESAELSYSQGVIDASQLISRIDDEFQARLNAEIHGIESLRESYKRTEE